MIQNYLKIAFRNLLKGRIYSLINIFGLSIGTALCILIMLFVKDEWTFDTFHSKKDRIYRSWVKEHFQGELFFNTVTPVPMGQVMRDELPEFEAVARFTTINPQVKKGELTESERVHVVEASFFDIFDFELLKGKADLVFDNLHNVVITEEMAVKYFGFNEPIGETLSLQIGDVWTDFLVSGIIETAPTNSSIQYTFLIPFENVKNFISERARQSWTNVSMETYALLREGADWKTVEGKMAPVFNRQVADIYEPGEYEVGLQPLTDIHLNNDFPAGIAPVSDWRYPYILSAIAILILLLAAINFTTLSVGRSISRSKEVGVRKVSGARRSQLMFQFWSEAILTAFIALILGVFWAEMALPTFNEVADKSLTLAFDGFNLSLLVGLAIVVGLISGIYPAFVLSGFSPLQSLRGMISKKGTDKHLILRALVGFQFTLSITLIVSTLIMQNQMEYLQNKNLGFDKEQVLVLPYNETPTMERRFSDVYQTGVQYAELLKNELAGTEGIKDITTSSHVFGTPGWMGIGYTDRETQKFRRFTGNGIDYNYLDMMDIELISGRNFSKDIATDRTNSVIINEAMVKWLDTENPIDQALPTPFEGFKIIGVTKDFNYSSLHSEVGPLAMMIEPIAMLRVAPDLVWGDRPTPKISIKLASDDLRKTISNIETAWSKVAPEQDFNYSFMDDNLNAMYEAENRLSGILSFATLLAIFIACLGLFGIATLTVARRTKEIGVRKILGATTLDLVFLLNSRFSIMVIIASILATPVAWYFMSGWLEDFAYRIDIGWSTFVLAGIFALMIVWLAVSYQSIRAALGNPVEALRYE